MNATAMNTQRGCACGGTCGGCNSDEGLRRDLAPAASQHAAVPIPRVSNSAIADSDFSRIRVTAPKRPESGGAPRFLRQQFDPASSHAPLPSGKKQSAGDDEPKLDVSMCGCQESLKFDILVANAFIDAYPKCAKKLPDEYGDAIHKCARKQLRKLGFRGERVAGSSTVGGSIKVESDPDKKCGSIHDYITLQHELRHHAHEASVRKEHPDEDEVFELLSNGPAVAAEEVEDYRVQAEQLAGVIARLDALCAAKPDTTPASTGGGGK
jgi:hypothetical protein